jgi:uncharacterized lipoprotein YddW (UPF0748 family)
MSWRSNNLVFKILIIVLSVNSAQLIAQPKYEFRGAWIATIGGIDWPSPAARGNTELQQQEYLHILDVYQQCNINAAIVQIRPAADAFYPTTTGEGWSKYLTGKSGMPPQPYYDPLEFMIAEAHKRGMEFHAWFNPYRALIDARQNIHPTTHPTYLHPNWFINYGGKKYFDPGLPAVRAYVIKVIMDVVNRYSIDAVHLDDYFYPYKIGKTEFNDAASYSMYNTQFLSKADWRRANVNTLVQQLNDSIKKAKPYVQFGISPFGVWRNNTQHPDGSNTTAGTTNYDDLYADVLLWLQKGWIDYVMPQLYWEQTHKAASYTTLLQWWSEHTYGKALYIGHGLYQLGTNKAACWQGNTEIVQQLNAVRANKLVQGSCYYSTAALLKNKLNITTELQLNSNATKSLVPAMPWLKAPSASQPIVNNISQANGYLSFTVAASNTKFYIIYQFAKDAVVDISKPQAIYTVSNQVKYLLPLNNNASRYAITSVGYNNIESKPVEIKLQNKY